MADAEGRIVLVNREIERLFGYSREELLGQHIERLVPERFRDAHPGYRHGFRQDPRVRAMGAGRDLYGLRKDGSEVPVEIGLTPVTTEAGMFVLGAVVDISARKQLEAEQRVLSEQLRQAQKLEAVGTLAGGIAHDFNNLLGAIIGYTELIAAAAANRPDIQADAQELLTLSIHGRRLVERILSFSRRQPSQRRRLALQETVHEVRQVLRATIPTTIDIDVEVANNLPPISADVTSLHQVLLNLASNGAQAMPSGGRLRIAAQPTYVRDSMARGHPDLHEGPYVILEVSDTGAGMDDVVRLRAMEPFFTTKQPGEGTGLGLAMVHSILRDHDGAVVITSAPDEGTSVRCFFPVAEDPQDDVAIANRADVARGSGQRILLVDDEPSLLRVGARRLELLGFSVTTAEGPETALAILANADTVVDLLITDYTMPHMSGVMLAREVRALRPELPIILLTGFIEDIKPDVLEAAGIQRLMRKPILTEELASACLEVLTSPR